MTDEDGEAQPGIEERVEQKLAEDAEREQPRDVAPGSTLYKSIHAIYGKIKRLEHTEKFTAKAGFTFTPADTFRDVMRQLFFEHGLIDRMTEVHASPITDGFKTGSVKFQYEFVIYHVETGEATIPVKRSVILPYVGSQTAGIASTFAWKEWIKNEFKISTGEMDPTNQMSEADDRAGEKLSVQESEEAAGYLSDALQELIATKPSKKKLEEWRDGSAPITAKLRPEHYTSIKAVWVRAWKAAPVPEPGSVVQANE